MKRRLAGRLGIHPGEGAPVALAAATLFLVDLSEALAANAGDALVLSRHGARGLGLWLAVSSLVFASLASVCWYFARRWHAVLAPL